MKTIIAEIAFLGQRFNSSSIADILLVACIFYFILKLLHETRPSALVRGLVIAVVVIGVLSVITNLPAFNWVISKVLPAFVIVIPIVFTPEIRRFFERLGRVRTVRDLFTISPPNAEKMFDAVDPLVEGSIRLASRKHGALIVLEHYDNLDRYAQTGVNLDSIITAELLLQIFYPNTPLHDGAIVIQNGRIHAAACVMPLSSSNVLNQSPERHMGLRHRAALGISEETDCLTIVVSEETGSISLAQNGMITRNIDPEVLRNCLKDAYRIPEQHSYWQLLKEAVSGWKKHSVTKQEKKSS